MHILIIPTKKHRSNVRPYWWGKNWREEERREGVAWKRRGCQISQGDCLKPTLKGCTCIPATLVWAGAGAGKSSLAIKQHSYLHLTHLFFLIISCFICSIGNAIFYALSSLFIAFERINFWLSGWDDFDKPCILIINFPHPYP